MVEKTKTVLIAIIFCFILIGGCVALSWESFTDPIKPPPRKKEPSIQEQIRERMKQKVLELEKELIEKSEYPW